MESVLDELIGPDSFQSEAQTPKEDPNIVENFNIQRRGGGASSHNPEPVDQLTFEGIEPVQPTEDERKKHPKQKDKKPKRFERQVTVFKTPKELDDYGRFHN